VFGGHGGSDLLSGAAPAAGQAPAPLLSICRRFVL